MDKMYEKMLCKTLDIRQKTVISERQKTNKEILAITQFIAVIEFPAECKEGKPRQNAVKSLTEESKLRANGNQGTQSFQTEY